MFAYGGDKQWMAIDRDFANLYQACSIAGNNSFPKIRLEVLDVAGHHVATLVDGFRAGPGQSVVWDGRHKDGAPAAPGVYLRRLQAGDVTQTRRILLIR